MRVELRDAQWWHCGALSRKICRGKWLAYHEAGIDIRAKLRELWGASIVRRSWFIDDRITAMGGVTGSILSRTGHLWLAVGPEVEKHRFAFMREAMANLDDVARMKRELRTTIAETDGTARRFAEWMGFVEDGEPMQIGQSSVRVIPFVLRR